MSTSTRPYPGGRVASSGLGAACPGARTADLAGREAGATARPWTAADVTEPNEQDPTRYEERRRAFVARTGTSRDITQREAADAIGRATRKVAAPQLGVSPDSNATMFPPSRSPKR